MKGKAIWIDVEKEPTLHEVPVIKAVASQSQNKAKSNGKSKAVAQKSKSKKTAKK